MRRLLKRGVLVATLCLCLPGTASAALVVSEDNNANGVITLTGDTAADATTVTTDGGNVRFTNTTAGANCTQDGTHALCPRGNRTISANLGAGDDSLDNRSLAEANVTAGDGADRVAGLLRSVNGDGGADLMRPAGTTGVVSLTGGAGQDVYDVGQAYDSSDIVTDPDGGTVDYLSRPAGEGGVTVTLNDNTANDGGSGEFDNVGAATAVRGTANADNLTADGNEVVDGEMGSDSLAASTVSYDLAVPYERPIQAARSGGVEVDLQSGSNTDGDTFSGTQNVVGTRLDDRLAGTGAANRLDGGDGSDTLTGRGAADSLLAGAGDDTVEAADGERDEVDCGPGSDRGTVDPLDALTACDGDGDGALEAADCNDADPGIRPGGTEVVGNSVDEDCDGIAAPYPVIGTAFSGSFKVAGTLTRVRKLRASNLPAGARARVTCVAPKRKKGAVVRRSTGCAFKRKTFTYAAATALARYEGLFKKRSLLVGTVVEIRVTTPTSVGRSVRYQTRTAKSRAGPKAASRLAPPGPRPARADRGCTSRLPPAREPRSAAGSGHEAIDPRREAVGGHEVEHVAVAVPDLEMRLRDVGPEPLGVIGLRRGAVDGEERAAAVRQRGLGPRRELLRRGGEQLPPGAEDDLARELADAPLQVRDPVVGLEHEGALDLYGGVRPVSSAEPLLVRAPIRTQVNRSRSRVVTGSHAWRRFVRPWRKTTGGPVPAMS